ncbi:MAG: hypothetical protein R3C99_11110 [Pirellulaceae bacterium]
MPAVRVVVAIGAVTAMVGVLLNLLLGLSRVALAMGRRADLPPLLGRLNESTASPTAAVVFVGLAVRRSHVDQRRESHVVVRFTVLIYYSLTNLTALRLNARERLYPKWIAAVGLVACAFLAFWVRAASLADRPRPHRRRSDLATNGPTHLADKPKR